MHLTVGQQVGLMRSKASMMGRRLRAAQRSECAPSSQTRQQCRLFGKAAVATPSREMTLEKLLKGSHPVREVEGPIRHLGLVVKNADLREAENWSDDVISGIRELIQKYHGVIAFRGQDPTLSVEQHLAFAKRFGTPNTHVAVRGLPGYPEVMQIEREPTANVIFGEGWHSDNSFQPIPSSYSFLRATGEMTPKGTNNTEFTNMIFAYQSFMSPARSFSTLRRLCLNNLYVSHSAMKAYGNADGHGKAAESGAHKRNSLMAMQETSSMQPIDAEIPPDVAHPVVIDVDGRPAFFISETFTNGIVGLPQWIGMRLIQGLQDYATRDEFKFEVDHEPHQVTMWDNRQLIHRGLANDASRRRVIHRVTVSSGARPRPLR